MGLLDDIFPDVATTIVEALGDSGVVFLRVSSGSYDPRTGAATSGYTDYPLDTAPAQGYSASQINGTTIRVGDFKILAAAQSVVDGSGAPIVPIAGVHSIVFKGTPYQVVSVQTVWSGQLPVTHTFQVRK